MIYLLTSSPKLAPTGQFKVLATFLSKREANLAAMAMAFEDPSKWYSVTPKEEDGDRPDPEYAMGEAEYQHDMAQDR